jgi:hypothetical protein
MASQWFIRGGGKVYGPLDDARLRRLVAEGKINEATELATDAKGPWHPASRVRGLFTSSSSSEIKSAVPTPTDTEPTTKLAPLAEEANNSGAGPASGMAKDGSNPASNSSSPPIAIEKSRYTNFAKWQPAVIPLALLSGLLFVAIGAAVILQAGVTLLPTRESTLLGSVFIVKADGESVRLGLTDVYVIPAVSITDEIVSEVKEALKSLRSAEDSLDYNSRPSPIDRAFSSPEVARQRRFNKTLEASEERAKALRRLADLRVTLMRDAVSQTKTDADGEFQIAVPNTPATSVVAYATRKIDAASEHYFWIIPSEEAKKQKPRLFISNDNQVR